MNVADHRYVQGGWRPYARVLLALAVLLLTAGCAARARDSLLLAASQALEECASADEHLQRALFDHSGAEKSALDSAFLADLEALAREHEGMVGYDDVVQAKRLYDERLAAITESRQRIGELFLNKRRTLQAALDLIEKARDLTSLEQRTLEEVLGMIRRSRELIQDQDRTGPRARENSQPTRIGGN